MSLKSNRKFIVTMSIVGLSALALLFNRLESGDFANVLVAVGVAFMGGNAMEHWSASGPSKQKGKAADGGD